MNNQLIEELYKTIEAKDNIINNQALEIANFRGALLINHQIIDMYIERINKTIEYINNASYFDGSSMCANDLLKILGDKE